MRRILQVSNQLESRGCNSPDCLHCKDGRGNGGNCRGCGTNYEIECQLCPDDERSVYFGESSRNLYTRCKEHVSRYQAGTVTFFMAKDQTTTHQGQEASYKAKVTASTRDCLTRQVREAVLIRRSSVPVLNPMKLRGDTIGTPSTAIQKICLILLN
jgi:hypothetical protein